MYRPSMELRNAEHAHQFARLLITIGVGVLPLLAYADFQKGFVGAAGAKSLTALFCLGGLLVLDSPRLREYFHRLVAALLFVMSSIGAVTKVPDVSAFVWIPALPLMFFILASVRAAIVYTACYYLIFVGSYIGSGHLDSEGPHTTLWWQASAAYFVVSLISYWYARANERLALRLRNAAEYDFLTGCANRRRLEEQLHREKLRADRYGIPFSVILLDLDNFKQVNDQHGHAEGDRLLVALSRLVSGQIRNSDIIGRWGGEEFVVLTPSTPLKQAVDLAEKLRHGIGLLKVNDESQMSASFGVAQYRPGESLEELMERADNMLYQAKNNGKNRVEAIPSLVGLATDLKTRQQAHI